MIEILKNYHGCPLIHAWTYYTPDGLPFGAVGRYEDKTGKKDIVPFFKRNGENWTAGIDLAPRPLFGLEKLAAHPKDKPVFIVEGEKCAAALQSLGLCAITSLGGSQATKKSDWTPLEGFKSVFLLPDNDAAGERYTADVLGKLTLFPQPPEVKTVHLPGLEPAGDVVDWLQGWLNNWDGYAPIADNLHEPIKAKLWAELEKPTIEPQGGAVSGFIWGAPGEIAPKLPPVDALTVKLIPEPFRAWLADVSHRMQTPGDFAAISSLVIVGSIIGAGCGIRPKQLDDWEVIPNLWGACIGRPSVVLKSPSMKEPMGQLDRLQAAYGAIYDREKAAGDFQGLVDSAVLKDLKTQLDKSTKGKGSFNASELQKLRDEYLELTQNAEPEPARRLFKTNETSIQSMTLLQNQNPRGLLVFRDELTGLLAKWDREDGADERAYFLEGWNGSGSYTDVKIGRGVTEAKTICISLLGGIQPIKLKKHLHQAQRGNDGMMQRLQLAVWPDEPEYWELIDIKPNREAKQAAFLIIQALAEMDFLQHGAIQGSHDDRPYFRFDDDAQTVFNEWLTELQTIKIRQEENPLMVEHFGKFRSFMPSLALIFHCIDIAGGKASGAVSERAAWLAVDWCAYQESHARRIYAMAESPEHGAAVRLAEKIKAGALPSPFNAKHVYLKGWHGLADRKEVEAACDVLLDEGWLKQEQRPKLAAGRAPLPDYHINPAL